MVTYEKLCYIFGYVSIRLYNVRCSVVLWQAFYSAMAGIRLCYVWCTSVTKLSLSLFNKTNILHRVERRLSSDRPLGPIDA